MRIARPVYALRLLYVTAALAVGSALAPAHVQNATGGVATGVYGLLDFTDLIEKTSPAVVNIRTTEEARMQQDGPNDDDMAEFFRRFFGVPMSGMSGQGQKRRNASPQQEEEQNRGVGSGFITSGDGYILTNAHVVEGAEAIYVTLIDKREYKAKLIGLDKHTDATLVKVEATGLSSLKLGDSDRVRTGEWVLVIGFPFGLDNTATAGVVSAKGRDIDDYLPFIQSDVAVNPGNSGDPLINLRGEMIGINNQIYSQSGGYTGILFLISINEAMCVAEQLKATGYVTWGRTGATTDNMPKDAAESLGLGRACGAYVGNVGSGGPADEASIEAGDIVLKYNGRDIEKTGDLQRQVGETKLGTRATMQVRCKDATRDLTVTVAELQADMRVAQRFKGAQSDNSQQGPGKPNALGLAMSDLSDGVRREFKTKSGVEVQASEGPAACAGIHPGDLILRAGDMDITNAKQFNEVVARLDKNRMVAVFVRRGDATQVVTLRPSVARSGSGR